MKLGLFRRKQPTLRPEFIYAVAADFLPKDKPLTDNDYHNAVGKAVELAMTVRAVLRLN